MITAIIYTKDWFSLSCKSLNLKLLQLPALISPGITLVISPLVSLIQDQIMHLLQVCTLQICNPFFYNIWRQLIHYIFGAGKYSCCLSKCQYGVG